MRPSLAPDVPAAAFMLTTNEERELPWAFVRRCLVHHLFVPKDDAEMENWLVARGQAHFPRREGRVEMPETVLRKVARVLIEDRKEAEKGPGQRMRWTEPGSFPMGSRPYEAERYDSEALHSVTLTQGFWMADTTCTQALWQAVLGGNPSEFKGEENPVDSVIWEDCRGFLEALNRFFRAPDLLCQPRRNGKMPAVLGRILPILLGGTSLPVR